jgi:hypothetical protein
MLPERLGYIYKKETTESAEPPGCPSRLDAFPKYLNPGGSDKASQYSYFGCNAQVELDLFGRTILNI